METWATSKDYSKLAGQLNLKSKAISKVGKGASYQLILNPRRLHLNRPQTLPAISIL
jgi:hypothetical protein